MRKHLKLLTKSAAVPTQVGAHNRAQQGGPKLGSGNGPFLYDGRTGSRSGRRMFPDQNRFTEWNHFLNRKWPRIDNQIAPKLPTSSPNRGLGLGHAGVFGCLLRKFAIAYSFKSNIYHTTNLLFVCCFTRCCLATADFEAAAFQVCRDCLAG